MNKRLKFKHILQKITQQPCLLCGAKTRDQLCQACYQDLPWHNQTCCIQCALPLANANNTHCGQCIANTPAFDRTHALLRYAFPIDQLLQAYKYQHQLNIAHFFAAQSLQIIKQAPHVDCIMPMPLHPQRLSTRGFNQSLEIARRLGKQWRLPVDTDRCKRIKNTPPQASLALKARINNVKNAFSCVGNVDQMRILLIDDVMTTGASLNALASSLKQAGAAQITCLVMARTIPHQHG